MDSFGAFFYETKKIAHFYWAIKNIFDYREPKINYIKFVSNDQQLHPEFRYLPEKVGFHQKKRSPNQPKVLG